MKRLFAHCTDDALHSRLERRSRGGERALLTGLDRAAYDREPCSRAAEHKFASARRASLELTNHGPLFWLRLQKRFRSRAQFAYRSVLAFALASANRRLLPLRAV